MVPLHAIANPPAIVEHGCSVTDDFAQCDGGSWCPPDCNPSNAVWDVDSGEWRPLTWPSTVTSRQPGDKVPLAGGTVTAPKCLTVPGMECDDGTAVWDGKEWCDIKCNKWAAVVVGSGDLDVSYPKSEPKPTWRDWLKRWLKWSPI